MRLVNISRAKTIPDVETIARWCFRNWARKPVSKHAARSLDFLFDI
jgi:hypothetical protein